EFGGLGFDLVGGEGGGEGGQQGEGEGGSHGRDSCGERVVAKGMKDILENNVPCSPGSRLARTGTATVRFGFDTAQSAHRSAPRGHLEVAFPTCSAERRTMPNPTAFPRPPRLLDCTTDGRAVD